MGLLHNPLNSLKFALTLYVFTYVGATFNLLTILTLAWVGAFTVPKVYLNNQSAVDEVVSKVMVQVEEGKGVDVLPASLRPVRRQEGRVEDGVARTYSAFG